MRFVTYSILFLAVLVVSSVTEDLSRLIRFFYVPDLFLCELDVESGCTPSHVSVRTHCIMRRILMISTRFCNFDVPTLGAVTASLANVQAIATCAILIPRLFAISSTLDNSLPLAWQEGRKKSRTSKLPLEDLRGSVTCVARRPSTTIR